MWNMRRVLEDLLDAGHPCHAVADDDQALHRHLPSASLADGAVRPDAATRRLFVVGFARNGIERALRHLVGVGLGVVERA